ncbi:ATP-binding protein [Thiospirochaeta perfilievii]|uniref:ATP-binding protein n=2 Tax=Thiospirochaeta perfilievii TaxID=252967 RepID=A0A5C1Q5S6_9SPIO|nr:ATP-binding protein [Thiospirochaeta perfilievii]
MAVDSLNPGMFKSFYICHTSVGIQEFYTHLCNIFGLQPAGRRAAMFKSIHEYILNMHRTTNIHPILVIDEADKLSTEILQELRLIANFNYDSVNIVVRIVCVAKPKVLNLR